MGATDGSYEWLAFWKPDRFRLQSAAADNCAHLERVLYVPIRNATMMSCIKIEQTVKKRNHNGIDHFNS